MNDKSVDANSGRLQSLEKENEELRKQLKEQVLSGDDAHSYRIFIEARKKLLGWLAGAVLFLTAFGFYSWNDVVNQIKDDMEEAGTENIIKDIRDQFVNEHREEIINRITKKIMPDLEKRVNNDAAGLIPELVARVEDVLRTEYLSIPERIDAGIPPQPNTAEHSEPSYKQKTYFVIAGSSPRREDLVEERKRVKDEAGGKYDELFPDVGIYPPFGSNINYALVIGLDLPYTEAVELKNKAISMGFRKDTFLWSADKAYFKQ
jgi:hypothetical protein